jgi:hypothetical protein
MFDIMKMMGKMKEVQERMKQAQDNLALLKISEEAGGGMVKVVVNGKKQLMLIDIDPLLLKVEDKIMVQDLIEEADVQGREQLKKSTEGLLPNIPGMDLSNLMG